MLHMGKATIRGTDWMEADTVLAEIRQLSRLLQTFTPKRPQYPVLDTQIRERSTRDRSMVDPSPPPSLNRPDTPDTPDTPFPSKDRAS
jgi:hypothetical protein